MINRVIHFYTRFKDFARGYLNRDKPFDTVNYWEKCDGEKNWFRKFMKSRGVFPITGTVRMYSVFGRRKILGVDMVRFYGGRYNLFFTGENVKCYSTYADHFLNNPLIDLALGFEVFESPRYMRLPLWMPHIVSPELVDDEVRATIKRLRFPELNTDYRRNFCALVARHDYCSVRETLLSQLSTVGYVQCPGTFKHNDDSLKVEYDDNKRDYLQTFRYNLCPENSWCYGYVTEKIIHAIIAGCIPIYWGGLGPDAAFVNTDAVLMMNPKKDNSEVLRRIVEMEEHPKLYKEFASQPRLNENAEEYILDMLYDLENRLREVFNSK